MGRMKELAMREHERAPLTSTCFPEPYMFRHYGFFTLAADGKSQVVMGDDMERIQQLFMRAVRDQKSHYNFDFDHDPYYFEYFMTSGQGMKIYRLIMFPGAEYERDLRIQVFTPDVKFY